MQANCRPRGKVQSTRQMSASGRLFRRLQAVIAKWPVDSTRKGRDLGEFLRDSYQQQFIQQAKTNVHPQLHVNGPFLYLHVQWNPFSPDTSGP